MCNFHATVWRLFGQEIQMLHDGGNSHSNMIDTAKWRVNEPNRSVIIFEAEWNCEGEMPKDDKLIRNSDECPNTLLVAIRRHYQRVREAITTGRHLDTCFADTKKWDDVWCKAIAEGVAVTLPAVFEGNLDVYGSAQLDAPALTKVGGYFDVDVSAKLDALTEVGGYLVVSGSAKLDAPALTKVGGYLFVDGSAKLDAPALTLEDA